MASLSLSKIAVNELGQAPFLDWFSIHWPVINLTCYYKVVGIILTEIGVRLETVECEDVLRFALEKLSYLYPLEVLCVCN